MCMCGWRREWLPLSAYVYVWMEEGVAPTKCICVCVGGGGVAPTKCIRVCVGGGGVAPTKCIRVCLHH